MKTTHVRRPCISFPCKILIALVCLAGLARGQSAGVLGGNYLRYGRILTINPHGGKIPPQLLHQINLEGELLLIKHRLLGIAIPANFYYQIDFCPDMETYRRFGQLALGQDLRGALGVTVCQLFRRPNGNAMMETTVPSQVICYYNHDQPWETLSTVLHEMCHAVIFSDYGVMPLWLQEGLPDWFSSRKYFLETSKKIVDLESYNRHMDLVQGMDRDEFIDFIAATEYGEWKNQFGDVGIGYFLAQTLIDFFIGNVDAQPFFRQGLAKAKAKSDWQFQRSITFAKYIEENWPGGISLLLKDWKNWYKIQSRPKPANELEPYLDANRRRFFEMVRDVRAKQVVTDADRYTLVSQWLAFKRLEVDDLTSKLEQSYHHGENTALRDRQWYLQQFANKDHAFRSPATEAHRQHLCKTTKPNLQDLYYTRTVPYQSLEWYLNLNIVTGGAPRPEFPAATKLMKEDFRWPGLDAWQANMIFTNLFTSYIGQSEQPLPPRLRPGALGPFTQALRENNLDAAYALKAVGGSVERDPITGQTLKLNLARTRIDDGDLEHLALLFQPLALDLSDTDIGGLKAFQHLAGWTSLRRLNLRNTRITADLVENLKRLAPTLVIIQ